MADSVATIGPFALALVPAQFRVEPAIWAGRYEKFVVTPRDSAPVNYVLNRDGSVNLTIVFHEDIAPQEAAAIARRYARESAPQSDRRWFVTVPPNLVRQLGGEDAVRWIDAGPAPELPDNDQTRTFINVEAVQNFNVATGTVQGVGGQGVRVGIFDNGVDETHDDFGTRLVRNDGGTAAHGTHVAGIVGGNGQASNANDSQGTANGGTAFQWRGMAPQVELIDAPGAAARTAANWLSYIQTHSLDVSNHSYSLSFDGAYDAQNQLRDQVIRGSATSGGTPIPPRLQAYSAGNHGQGPLNGGEQIGYFALTKQVKNGIIVGDFDRANNRIALTSSLGPSHDGRIKPDVVAPGTNIRSTGFATAFGPTPVRRDFYRLSSGTSMAAPAVTGVLALVLQQYATSYGVNLDVAPPWPSTIRAAVIQTATDMASPTAWFTNADAAVRAFAGPDFVTGFGLVNGQAAVNLVANRRLIQDSVVASCDTAVYWMKVPMAQAEVRVTLAWDDFEGNPALGAQLPQLVNDLDLVLVQPDATLRYPWLLDQQVVDGAGAPVMDVNQICGTAVTVRRAVLPTATPNFVNVGDPANVNDAIPAGALQAAGNGKDHLNNVEQVVVNSPAQGLWKALVIGFNIAQPNQRFSLVGFNAAPVIVVDNGRICRKYPGLCGHLKLFDLCRRRPYLCNPIPFEPRFNRIPIRFMNLDDRLFIPAAAIREFAAQLERDGRQPQRTISSVLISSGMSPLSVEAYSIKSGRRARITAGRPGQIRLDSLQIDDYLLVIAPTKGARVGVEYELMVTPAREP